MPMKYGYGDHLASECGSYEGVVIKIFPDFRSIPYFKYIDKSKLSSFLESKGFELINTEETWYQIQDFERIDHMSCESKLILKHKIEIHNLI